MSKSDGVLTPARQCHYCKKWIWLPNWWTHNRHCQTTTSPP